MTTMSSTGIISGTPGPNAQAEKKTKGESALEKKLGKALAEVSSLKEKLSQLKQAGSKAIKELKRGSSEAMKDLKKVNAEAMKEQKHGFKEAITKYNKASDDAAKEQKTLYTGEIKELKKELKATQKLLTVEQKKTEKAEKKSEGFPHIEITEERYGNDIPCIRNVRKACEEAYAEIEWGAKEGVYQQAVVVELRKMGYTVETEIANAIMYKGHPLSNVHWDTDIDLYDSDGHLVLVIELKATGGLSDGDKQQCRRYMKQKDAVIGIAVNFPNKAFCTEIEFEMVEI